MDVMTFHIVLGVLDVVALYFVRSRKKAVSLALVLYGWGIVAVALSFDLATEMFAVMANLAIVSFGPCAGLANCYCHSDKGTMEGVWLYLL